MGLPKRTDFAKRNPSIQQATHRWVTAAPNPPYALNSSRLVMSEANPNNLWIWQVLLGFASLIANLHLTAPPY